MFRDVVHPLFHETFVHPKVKGIPTDPGRIDEVLTRVLPEVFGYLDAVATAPFLAGDAPSVADLAVMSNLTTMQYIGFALDRARFPRLAHLFDRVIRIPAVTEALRAEQPVVQQMGLRSEFLNAVLG